LPWASATAQVTPRGRIDRSFRSRGASILWGKNMTEFELLAQAAASAANIPNVPLVIKLAEIGSERCATRENKAPSTHSRSNARSSDCQRVRCL
jgi:hypothetical protein